MKLLRKTKGVVLRVMKGGEGSAPLTPAISPGAAVKGSLRKLEG